MQVTINGEAREITDGLTVSDLIHQLELADRRIAVEINRNIVPRAVHAETPLQADDAIEIIHAIGGG